MSMLDLWRLAIWARTCASTFVGSCTASVPSTRIRFAIRTSHNTRLQSQQHCHSQHIFTQHRTDHSLNSTATHDTSSHNTGRTTVSTALPLTTHLHTTPDGPQSQQHCHSQHIFTQHQTTVSTALPLTTHLHTTPDGPQSQQHCHSRHIFTQHRTDHSLNSTASHNTSSHTMNSPRALHENKIFC